MAASDTIFPYIPTHIDENKRQIVPAEADNFPIRLRQYRNAARFMMHWHSHMELLYFRKGGASIYCGGEEFLTNDGDLVIVNINDLHRGDFTESGVHYFCIQIPPELFSLPGTDHRHILQTHICGDSTIGTMFGEIYSVYWAKEAGYKFDTLGKIFTLIGYLIRNYSSETLDEKEFAARTRKLENINKLIDYVELNYAEALTTEKAAEMTHLSEFYFCHLFKERMGVSFTAYLNDIRIRKAITLLNSSTQSITEIAAAVGYSDVNYFSRLFKRKIGVSPRNYRER